MLRFLLLALAALAFAPVINAVPANGGTSPVEASSSSSSLSPRPDCFSFEKWTGDISKTPNATHLSSEQALAAAMATASTPRHHRRRRDAAWRSGDLQTRAFDRLRSFGERLLRIRTIFKESKRPSDKAGGTRREGIDISSVRCNTFPRNMAAIPSIVGCIERLARSDKTCDTTSVKSFCQAGNNFILGWRKLDELSIHSPSCRGVARSAGRIMDYCAFDGLVMGEATAWDDPAMGVMIREFPDGKLPANLTLLR